MIVLVSLIELLRTLLVSTIIRMVHPHTSFIHLNDFCTCFTHLNLLRIEKAVIGTCSR